MILWRIIEEVLLHLSRRGRQKPFGRFVDESQKRIRLRLLDIAIKKVGPAFVPVVNPDQSGTTIGSANA
jgi:hypothetical protein